MVHCRICHGAIDKDKTKQGQDWIMPSTNYYYHTRCYEDWARKTKDIETQSTDPDMWKDALYKYLTRELRISIDFVKMSRQWENNLGKGFTPKGIYFAIRYFYEIKKGDPKKAEQGIGIIPYIYKESSTYWVQLIQKGNDVCEKIEEQIRALANRPKEIRYKMEVKEVNKPSALLKDIAAMEDKDD
jgi:hypothetical protein